MKPVCSVRPNLIARTGPQKGLFRRQLTASLATLSLILPVAMVPHAAAQTTSALGSPMQDAAVRQRVDALLQQMTPEEKTGQLSQLFLFTKPDAAMEARI